MAFTQHLAADSPYDRHLHQLRIYRGQLDATKQPGSYGASPRQYAQWESHPLVKLVTRPLRYPSARPTDLKPALEYVAELAASRGRPRAEVAAWPMSGQHCRRLALNGRSLYCHWIDEGVYKKVQDKTDYTRSS
ncbi:hypothetical protein IHE55_20385 [Streptomyces pactum]|uniref:Integrase n=1 Tax=Streptomyces pactum TaxID=68249 RepID=A0ABS0NPH6_9ACTN|nr:hypothetical protein [Streptomyces pactum]MBH5336992.1 hypothetical protein [Streptomyces pactum]